MQPFKVGDTIESLESCPGISKGEKFVVVEMTSSGPHWRVKFKDRDGALRDRDAENYKLADSHDFMVGELILCVRGDPANYEDETKITTGKTYKVVNVNEEGWPSVMSDHNVETFRAPNRFQWVEAPKAEKNVETPDIKGWGAWA